MSDLYAVIREHGPAWDDSRALEDQDSWPEHARFMNGLAEEGFVELGGPLGEGGGRVLLAVRADSPDVIRARFDADPWVPSGHLVITSIEAWEIRLDSRETYSQRK
jgi:hypothetical protein